MPSNREWLNDLAASDPQKLNVWFEAEHVDDNDEISKLKAERDEWKAAAKACETCDGNYIKVDELKRERDEWKAKAESALHENPYVGLVRGKQWERTEISDYYCGRCGWKVTADSKFDARKTAETPETDAAKGDIRDFDDSREKLRKDIINCTMDSYNGCWLIDADTIDEWLDRQAEITAKRLCSECAPNVAEERDYLRTRVDELNTQVQEQSELIAARGKTIEALEKFMSERKYKLKKQLESKTEQCRKLKVERDEYRELYEAAMSTDYGQLSKEHEQFREEISEMLDAAQQIERIAAKYEE